MKTTYFKNIETLEELRKQYKELLKKFHPDILHGSTETTQEVNAEYDHLFSILKDRHEHKTADSATGTQSSYNANIYDWEKDNVLRDVLQKIINFEILKLKLLVNGSGFLIK